MNDLFTTTATRQAAASLLEGGSAHPGFVFHDDFNQPVHRAAPGLLGLVEGRLVIARWKPRSLAWLDGTGHFFNHLLFEFQAEPSFEPIRRELEAIAGTDAPYPARNAFLFQYLTALIRELERDSVARWAPTRTPAGAGPDVSLNGTWTARYCAGEEWTERELGVPLNWELVPNIDNYAGTMRFTRLFSTPGLGSGRQVSLRFAGLDYFADVWVNGYHLGGHEGYFGPFQLDVSPYLRPDDNILRVAVTSPNDPSGCGTHVTSGWDDFSPASAFPNRKTLIKGTLGHHDAKRGGAWSSITSQDGNTGGVWDDVRLRVCDTVSVDPSRMVVTTLSTTPGRAAGDHRVALHTRLTVGNATGTTVKARLRLAVEPANFDGPAHELFRSVRLRPGDNDVLVAGTVSPVRLWNPADHGFPHLYRVTAIVEVDGGIRDEATVETGFRTLSVSPIGESTGVDGAWVVNGREVFPRGTNLLPTYWLSEYSPERVDADFALLRAGGFNAVLVHNVVAPRAFYERANREGLLVVQMFPLQWTYEQSGEMVEKMTGQTRDMASLFANDPSVVSYDVHNEPDMRTFDDLDNRYFDFDLHAALREADPSRWATTFSGGNHAYPGQFYPLRDDNGFATLPARFLQEEVHGRRISRHRNMPTEFGIQAMPNTELFGEIVAEDRVREVLERIRNDPKWLAAGAESWQQASKTLDEAASVLGRGSWARALKAFDWSLLWDLGELDERIRRAEAAPTAATGTDTHAELVSLKLAVLLLDVLHYGGFKGENFWFGLWKPASSLEGLVRSSQARQYRLHKDSIEHYLNAGAVGPIVGYFSFMFRDADWEAPTWGVVDASWTPKKAYRAYLESNAAVRVTLPHALRSPVKLPGDPWFAAVPEDRARFGDAPWAGAELIVANDTLQALTGARVDIWLEDSEGVRLALVDYGLSVDVGPTSAWTSLDGEPVGGGVVPEGLLAGRYLLRARLSTADGAVLSTNAYEMVVPDTGFGWIEGLSNSDVAALLDGLPGTEGFHYWHGGAVALRARPGLRGLLAGWSRAESRGFDLYDTVQGEHLFRHLLPELAGLAGADRIADDVWTIRSEVVSPEVKARTLLRYAELFVRRAEEIVAMPRRRRSKPSPPPVEERPPTSQSARAVGRDIAPARRGRAPRSKP